MKWNTCSCAIGLLCLPLCFVVWCVVSIAPALAVEPTPPRSGVTQPRTGQTQRFGSGTITNRSDGSQSQTQPFGNGTIQRDQPGRSR